MRSKARMLTELERYANDPAVQPVVVVDQMREVMLGTVLLSIVLIATSLITVARIG